MTDGTSFLDVRGTRLEVRRFGAAGPDLLFLGAGLGIHPGRVALDVLGQRFKVIVPSHPGFGTSDRPKWITTVDDLSYFYLDMLEALDLRRVVMVGVSFGAWIAAEIAVKTTSRIAALVLASPVGIKVSDRETADIADIFSMTDVELKSALYATAAVGNRDYRSMADSDVSATARNRESLARFAWSPYMHDPKLRDRLHRVDVPTLFLRGAQDGLISESYVRAFCAEVLGGRSATVEGAGHFLHVEQPELFAGAVLDFLAVASNHSKEGELA